MRPFSFKKFQVHHENCAHKIGTDAVLLGSWAGEGSEPKRILDVGSGSGVIGFMLAQRFPNAEVYLLENHKPSVLDCKETLESLPWRDRIQLVQEDLFEWQPNCQFDLVASNPPYFVNSLESKDHKRRSAKHISSDSFGKWLKRMESFLSPIGRLSLIVPEQLTIDLDDLDLVRRTTVKSKVKNSNNRLLLEWTFEPTHLEETEFSLRTSEGKWTREYLEYTSAFLTISN